MSIENRSLKLPHSSGVLCGQKRSIFGEGIDLLMILSKCIINYGLYYKRIASLIANTPAWGPSGTDLIYTEGVIGSNSQILKINLTSQKVAQLTDDGSNYSGNWFRPRQLPVSPSPSLLNMLWGNMKIRD